MKNFLLFILSFLPLTVTAITFDVNGIRYEILSKTEKTVSVAIMPVSISEPSTSKYSGEYNIPETVEFNNVKYNVIAIGDCAFHNCYKKIAVTIPNSIKSIGEFAFSNSRFDSINLPEGIESIGCGAFKDCYELTEVTLPKSLKFLDTMVFSGCTNLKTVKILSQNLTEIPDESFYKCTSLSTVNIPNSVTMLGKEAFLWTKCLTSINIPAGVTSIGEGCFVACGISSISIPDGVTELSRALFSGCSNLQSIKLPAHLTSLNEAVFSGCALKSFSVPDGVVSIPARCFAGCSLVTISLPNTIKYIYDHAFSDCSLLDNVVLPEGVELLDDYAFYGCRINNIELPSTLKKIGSYCFGFGPNMKTIKLPISLTNISICAFRQGFFKEVICMNPIPATCEPEVFMNDAFFGTLYVPIGSLERYESTKPWSEFFSIQEHGFLSIDDINDDTSNKVVSYTNQLGLTSKSAFLGWNIIHYSNGKYVKSFVK